MNVEIEKNENMAERLAAYAEKVAKENCKCSGNVQTQTRVKSKK